MNCVPSPSSSHQQFKVANSHDPFSIDAENPEFLRLHDHIAGITRSLRNNMQRLDLDLSSSAQPSHRGPSLDKALLRIVFSGCVATSAYIPCSGKDLYVTQVGDCGAVLGSFVPSPMTTHTSDADTGEISLPTEFFPMDWKAELLISPHNADNEIDVHRLRSSHPVHESAFVLRDDRLLGELMPLRAFGDIRFKWPSKDLKHVARLLDLPPNYPIMPSFYETPPYLCSIPQVTWRPLMKNRDHFLVLATDGLWDMLSPKEAINVVAQHWFDYTGDPSSCGPGDTAASRLIRTALGGDQMDPERISAHFSMPATVARYYRDDITVVVVYLPTSAAITSG
ncbi:[Pyruvate dehydrogenase [acetyl-transferring]]-phosphatase 2 [Fasciola gigantica]|uniref:[Pyruvate dehydrogenase [acetyl-transferring]]-phosphatase 2 n=1 Tax=Fasciola gigantica TaxID=46835 RepID=A0A504Y7R3_FASGI|nr:[Pyruvate dehydrogenase [acetyl-transferring]]-phosphatase 2 [Fasciola gigantica]